MFVIAEAGVNHNGSWGLAEEIIKQAKLAGADAVKWQTYKAEDLVTKTAPRFWNWEGDDPGSQYDSYKKLESFANENACRVLADICGRYGIEYMTTPFSLEAVRWNSSLVKRWKIASGDITNKQLIDAVADTGKQILLSTGGTALNEISEALSWIGTRARVVVMHCNLKYPTEDGDVNLGALMDLRRMRVEQRAKAAVSFDCFIRARKTRLEHGKIVESIRAKEQAAAAKLNTSVLKM
jgi:sialic acid synthase SpsE